ncbi:MAG: PhzF family phenazine biosynthesis protein [Tissierellia bacterium]|nr:PhzF family phenazine biosynthesis protein [Tissierellia bacterium]
MKYYVVDAFADQAFGGNPAGVVVSDGPLEKEFMQKFAREMRFSETVFSYKDGKEVVARFFTPEEEVPLCGHATVALFSLLREENFLQVGNHKMKTINDVLEIALAEEKVFFQGESPVLKDDVFSVVELSEIFGIPVSGIWDDRYKLIPMASSTGLVDLMLPLKSKDLLHNLQPDFQELKFFSFDNDLCGVHAFTLDADGYIAETRNFAPLYGIDEEAATGTATGALTWYLYKNEVIKDFDTEFQFLQGVSMGRPSIIHSVLKNKENPKVYVGGSAKVLTAGEVRI